MARTIRFGFLAVVVGVLGGLALLGAQNTVSAAPTPIIPFDLTVSLEWQPGTDDNLPDDLALAGCTASTARAQYVDDLTAGLRQASAYLYSYSQGQMALRNIKIYTGGEQWSTADIRVLADGNYRPTAYVGGIVSASTPYTATATGVGLVFHPGEILLGRLWNGTSGRCGAWSEAAGYRTIGHEWAHYALYLYDEYLNQSTAAAQYCTSTGLVFGSSSTRVTAKLDGTADSLMAYHYTADQLWRGNRSPPSPCLNTPQMRVHGMADWPTIKHFYPGVTVPSANAPGPALDGSPAAEPYFNVSVVPPATPRAHTTTRVTLAPLARPSLGEQGYLIRSDAEGFPQQIIGQGSQAAGARGPLVWWGVQQDSKDRAAILVQDQLTGERSYYPRDYRTVTALVPGATNPITPTASVWQPSLLITPLVLQSSRTPYPETLGLRVTLQDCAQRTRVIQLSYCPAGGTCSKPVSVTADANGVFSYTFGFPVDSQDDPPAVRGTIYARNPDTNEETMSWYQMAGGVGPANIPGHPPLVDGAVSVDVAGDALLTNNRDTRVLYQPAQRCGLGRLPLPRPVLNVVGTPFDIQVVVADAEGGTPWGTNPTDPPLSVRLSYDQDVLDRLGIDETQLIVLRYDPREQRWLTLPLAGHSLELDWVALPAQQLSGQPVLLALAYQPPQGRLWLPLVVRPK